VACAIGGLVTGVFGVVGSCEVNFLLTSDFSRGEECVVGGGAVETIGGEDGGWIDGGAYFVRRTERRGCGGDTGAR
jgi:hypothetical protein